MLNIVISNTAQFSTVEISLVDLHIIHMGLTSVWTGLDTDTHSHPSHNYPTTNISSIRLTFFFSGAKLICITAHCMLRYLSKQTENNQNGIEMKNMFLSTNDSIRFYFFLLPLHSVKNKSLNWMVLIIKLLCRWNQFGKHIEFR